jgi:hypothetical protein
VEIFDKYEIVRRLAYGGMGEVFLARQGGAARFDRLVILKSLRPELAQDEEVVEEFLEEARLAATLNHPNIVSIHEVGEWAGTYFIAMEYIHGEDVFRLCQQAIAQGRWVPPRVAVRMARDAALGLDAAHSAKTPDGQDLKIVHRDVTPRNLMVRLDGVTKVVDFGVAKAADRAARTVTGGLKGTIAYMSPEQAFARGVDARSDQYGLGVILWELLAKQRLFGGKDSIEVLEAVRSAKVGPPSDANEAVPKALDDLVMRMLAPERDDRFPSCRVVADAMSQWLGEMAGPPGQERVSAFVTDVAGDAVEARTADLTPTGMGLVPTESTVPTPAPRPATGLASGRAGWLAAAASIALATGMGIALFTQGPRPLPPLPPLDAGPAPSGEPARLAAAATAPPVEPTVSSPAVTTNEAADAGAPPVLAVAERPPIATGEGRSSRPRRPPVRKPAAVVASATPSTTAPSSTSPSSTSPTGSPVTTAPPAVEQNKAPALVTLDTVPWTQVTVDGAAKGATPVYRMELKAGRHIVHLVNPEEGIDVWRDLVLQPGQELHLDWKLGEQQ